MREEVKKFIEWLETLSDQECEESISELHSKVCRYCGAIGDGECYCTRDD